jgi:hypothetical protein
VPKQALSRFRNLSNRNWLKEQRTKVYFLILVVPTGKKAMFFIDDLNMPRKDQFGTQSAMEILR